MINDDFTDKLKSVISDRIDEIIAHLKEHNKSYKDTRKAFVASIISEGNTEAFYDIECTAHNAIYQTGLIDGLRLAFTL